MKIDQADLSYTNALLDPQVVWNKNLSGTQLVGVDLSDKDFSGVDVTRANLDKTGARLSFDQKREVLSCVDQNDFVNALQVIREKCSEMRKSLDCLSSLDEKEEISLKIKKL